MTYLSLFQIGPVQEFIQTARKTQDFWSGSFLLSYLNSRAIAAYGEKDIIFPKIEGSKIYQGATSYELPWKGLGDEFYTPSIPNRFLAQSDFCPRERLESAKKAVIVSWVLPPKKIGPTQLM